MTEANTGLDAELAIQAQAGDTRAFDRLVLRHKGLLYRFVRRLVGNDDDAYDIVQDSFISAWLALPRYDPQKPFLTWLRAIALNKCRDLGRRQAARRRLLRIIGLKESEIPTENEMGHPLGQEARDETLLRRLDHAIAALPTFYKEPLLLVTVAGLSQKDAALQLHTTTKAIEMRIRRAKKKLTEALSDLRSE